MEQICADKSLDFLATVKAAGLSAQSYRWRRKECEPSLGAIIKFCMYLNIPLSTFFNKYNDGELTAIQSAFLSEWRKLSEFEQKTIDHILDVLIFLKKV